ncbi:ROK family protein [Desulfonispora thiosulfatigenes]|uniref:ROK family protein n=1 Tax=Desulfonispora thiosulfatigenes TaxID=83661 RepID=UPI0013564475|nr:ROK family protein [Desulfonispora thiosulfatigenes]
MIKIREYSIGIDVGGTNIKAGLLDEDGKIQLAKSIKTQKEQGYISIIKKIIGLINSYQDNEELKIKGVGLALPGAVNDEKGLCLYCPNLKWDNINISSEIENSVGLKVKLINDANAACLGDYFYGVGKNSNNIIYLTLGTGLGSAVIIDNKLLQGKDKAAVEAGHMIIEPFGYPCSCGSRGCFETLVSATAIERRYSEKQDINRSFNKGNLTSKMIFEAYRNNDILAIKTIDETKEYLAIGISNLINIFNGEKVILAGGVMHSKEIILEGLENRVKECTYPSMRNFTITVSKLGDNAGVMGAASLFFKTLKVI